VTRTTSQKTKEKTCSSIYMLCQTRHCHVKRKGRIKRDSDQTHRNKKTFYRFTNKK
jgi:hypothetical protein